MRSFFLKILTFQTIRIVAVACAIWFFGLPNANSETLYVKKSGTKVRVGATAESEILKRLNRGTPVEVLSRFGKFVEVTAPGIVKGWIFKFKLSPKPPKQEGGFLDIFGK